jgi:hypothetical protein
MVIVLVKSVVLTILLSVLLTILVRKFDKIVRWWRQQ